jgi:hypothetical protein
LFSSVFRVSIPDYASGQTVNYKMPGQDFSPYIDGQDPNHGSQISEQQLRNRMEMIIPHTEWIRTFGTTDGLEKAGLVARSLGLKAAIGAWIGPDANVNERQITNLINICQAGQCDMAIVGSESLLRGGVTEQQLLDYIRRVRQSIPWGPDNRTRVAIFAMNLDLLPGENASIIIADAEDVSHHVYPLTVEYVGPGFDGLSGVVIRLSDDMGDVGDVLVRIKARGVSSNRVRLGIGHLGEGPNDDPGAVPTPGRP